MEIIREFLFRGKRKDNGEWIEGGVLAYGDYVAICVYSDYHGWHEFIEVIPETVGQYTELPDKNGKKIFEGDIIKSESRGHKAISVVKYGKCKPRMFYDLLERYFGIKPKENICGMFATTLQGEDVLLTDCSKVIEIIGNIHDNPELLKEGAE